MGTGNTTNNCFSEMQENIQAIPYMSQASLPGSGCTVVIPCTLLVATHPHALGGSFGSPIRFTSSPSRFNIKALLSGDVFLCWALSEQGPHFVLPSQSLL